MIESLPIWINLLFIVISVLTIVFFHFSNGKPHKFTLVIVLWSVVHSILAYSDFYQDTDSFPPRFALVLLPSIVVIIYGILPKQMVWVSERRNTNVSTYLHTVRLPVEIILFGLYTRSLIPKMMTFEGYNFDIVMGITAVIIGALFIKNIVGKSVLLVWNCVGLIMILAILFMGVFSAELPFQLFGYDQPNRAVNYFPFVLLPATIVPIVIWTHLTDIILLSKTKKGTTL